MKRVVEAIINGEKYEHIKKIELYGNIMKIEYSFYSEHAVFKKEFYISQTDFSIQTKYVEDKIEDEYSIHKPKPHELKDLFKNE